MLKNLTVSHFTIFPTATFELSPELNILVGDNGAGKSHFLQLGYCLAASSYAAGQSVPKPTKKELQQRLAEKLIRTLRPDTLGRLVSRKQGRTSSEVSVEFVQRDADMRFRFASNSRTGVRLARLPRAFIRNRPIFLAPRERLSSTPGFAEIYADRELERDEASDDLGLALESRPLEGQRPGELGSIIATLEEALEGRVRVENGQLHVSPAGDGQETLAEGARKLAMLACLLGNGELGGGGALFWDAPETSLNPPLIKALAGVLVRLAQNGVQVLAATHSLFLLRELEILRQQQLSAGSPLATTYFALNRKTAWEATVQSGATLDSLGPIAALDEDLKQSDRYLQQA